MIKKIMAVLMTFVLSMSLVGCSNSDSSDKKQHLRNLLHQAVLKSKMLSDFQEADGIDQIFYN